MRWKLLVAALLFAASPAFADSTVPALTAGTTLTGTVLYGAQGGTLDRKFGMDTALFGISTGNITINTASISNALLTNSSVTVNTIVCSLGGSCTVPAAAGTLTGATLAAGVTASSLTSVGTLTSLTMGGTLAMGTNTISGNFTASGVPVLSGLSAGTQVSCLGLDSGNHVVLNAAACGSGGSSSGVGVQGGQSPSNIGDNTTALPSGSYLYVTNANMTAQRTHNLPSSATQNVGMVAVFDQQGTVTNTNQLCVAGAGTDQVNGVTNGTACISTARGWVFIQNDGAGHWTTGPNANAPSPTDGQIFVGKTGSPSNTIQAVTMSQDCALTNAGVITCTKTNNVSFGTAATVNTGTSGATIPLLNGANTWSAAQTFGATLGTENDQSGTTYTLAATDCGKTVAFSNASAVTVTIAASIVPAAGTTCNIAIRQDGAGQVAVNGTAVSAATLVSAHSYTKTFGAHAVIGLELTTISSTATAVLTGDGA